MRRIKLGTLALGLVLSGGLAACSDEDDPMTPLTAPANVTATRTGGQATVTWSAVAGATAYSVQRQVVAPGAAFTTLASNVTATTYADTVSPGNLYQYRVIAVRGAEQSAPSDPVTLEVAAAVATLTSIGNATRTLSKDTTYVISGLAFVDSGGVLNIPAGTRLLGDTVVRPSALVIRKGARINANGTAQEPIVFTSRKPVGQRKRGDWGGIVINGRSNCNFPAPCTGEAGSGQYGGNQPDDNSGILRYVRIEFAGYEVSPNNELNALTLNGVGRGTTIEHVQVHYGSDDGIEWFGGTVDVKYALATGNSDDSFDYSTGWQGRGQFWIVQQDTLEGDRGFEVDGNETNFTAQPYTDPVIYNVTLVGRNGRGSSSVSPAGLQLRRGTRGDIRNSIIVGFTNGIDIDDQATADQCAANELSVASTIVFNVTNVLDPDADAFEAACTSGIRNENPGLTDPFNLVSPNFVPQAGAAALTGAAALPGGGFFTAADYLGAVAPTGTPWYQGWTTFARN